MANICVPRKADRPRRAVAKYVAATKEEMGKVSSRAPRMFPHAAMAIEPCSAVHSERY